MQALVQLRNCGNCRFFTPANATGPSFCRRAPPTAVNGGTASAFPPVPEHWRCFSHRVRWRRLLWPVFIGWWWWIIEWSRTPVLNPFIGELGSVPL